MHRTLRGHLEEPLALILGQLPDRGAADPLPLAAGVLAPWGVVLAPAVGAVAMSLSIWGGLIWALTKFV